MLPVISHGSTVCDEILCKWGAGSRGRWRAVPWVLLHSHGLSSPLAFPHSCMCCMNNRFSEPLARLMVLHFLIYASSLCNGRGVPSPPRILFNNLLEI